MNSGACTPTNNGRVFTACVKNSGGTSKLKRTQNATSHATTHADRS